MSAEGSFGILHADHCVPLRGWLGWACGRIEHGLGENPSQQSNTPGAPLSSLPPTPSRRQPHAAAVSFAQPAAVSASASAEPGHPRSQRRRRHPRVQ